MERIKMQITLLDKLVVENQRIYAQINAIHDDPTAYQGETLLQAIGLMMWHLDEQIELIKSLRKQSNQVNHFIDEANKIYQRGKCNVEKRF